jgi:glycosyltransferase involved in cell wall biosynthesis
MRASVIVSTYNKPAWLEKVLWGYSCQDWLDFELIVADDGSGEETRRLIARFAGTSPFPIRHLWHEDQGYRRSVILNAAMLAARAEYLVFSDGDCIPRQDFVRTHVELAAPGRFLSGGSVSLSMGTSEALGQEDVVSGRFAKAWFLASRGEALGRHRLRLLPRGVRATVLDRLTTTRPTWNLNNASTWRESLFKTNGMESEMQYGGADRALGSRLENLGLRGKQVRFRAVLIHLDHDRPYKTRESIQRNKAIRRRIVRDGEVRAREGLTELQARMGERPFHEMTVPNAAPGGEGVRGTTGGRYGATPDEGRTRTHGGRVEQGVDRD